ncbi:MAG: SPOR domain-containing protein, partial [Pseudomonadota bacterium]
AEPLITFEAEPEIGEPEVIQSSASATDLAVAAALSEVAELTPTPASLTVQAAEGVPLTTPRPLGRPAGLRVTPAAMTLSDATGEVDPATIPPGTRLVQLGAYGSAEVARAEWAAAQARFGDYMVGKDPVVQEAETAGRKFWRLRMAGFSDLPEASRFCAVLVSDGANCIPVVQE